MTSFGKQLGLVAVASALAWSQAGLIKGSLDKAGQMKTEGAKHAAAVEAVQPTPDPKAKQTAPAASKEPAKPSPTPAPAKQTAPPPAKGASTAPAKEAPKQAVTPAKSAAPAKGAATAPAKAAPKQAATPAKEAPQQATTPAKSPANTAAKTAPKGTQQADRGDPFVIPLRKATSDVNPPTLPPGQGNMLVSQIELQGLVKAPSGYRAWVKGPHERTYFLKVNDKVLNGRVTKITDTGVSFEEEITDPLGRMQRREVEKTLPTGKK